MNKEKLKKWVCKHPFEYMDLQPYQVYVCCPSWCPQSIRDHLPQISWQSKSAIEIRKSVLDGSYRYCDHNICPALNVLLNSEEVPGHFIEKEEFFRIHNIDSIEDVEKIETHPEVVLFGFDRSCNFRCPSCRDALVPNDDENSHRHKEKLETLRQIEEKFSSHIKSIMITGSGDPFYSKIYRDYLINFDETKYPKLEEIRIITNARMLTQKMWESLKAKKFIKTIEVSVDAGTKKTYEEVTRIGGDWETLWENIKFISTIPTLQHFTGSFVVSELNFREMSTFHRMIQEIFEKSHVGYDVFFTQHVHWGTGLYTPEDVERISVFKKEHSLFDEFMTELNLIHKEKNTRHNFHHLLA